jgi:hypothetical protein
MRTALDLDDRILTAASGSRRRGTTLTAVEGAHGEPSAAAPEAALPAALEVASWPLGSRSTLPIGTRYST